MKDLEENEIKAAIDLANWLDKADDELKALAADKARKEKYLGKLTEDLAIAQATCEACEARYQEILDAIAFNEDELKRRTAEYNSETQRRKEEVALLQECIKIFEERVKSLHNFLNNQQ